jgi:hypothetical protein
VTANGSRSAQPGLTETENAQTPVHLPNRVQVGKDIPLGGRGGRFSYYQG